MLNDTFCSFIVQVLIANTVIILSWNVEVFIYVCNYTKLE